MKKIVLFILISTLLTSCKEQCECDYGEKSDSRIEGVKSYFNLDDAITCAQKCNKPIFLCFSGYAFVSSFALEEKILSESVVKKKLLNDFVVLYLHVDEDTPLPVEMQYTVYFNGMERTIRTIGNQNAYYQVELTNKVTQPYCAILDQNGENLIGQFAYSEGLNSVIVDSILSAALKK